MNTLFLDRDGVLNVLRHNDYVKCPDELEILPKTGTADIKDIASDWRNPSPANPEVSLPAVSSGCPLLPFNCGVKGSQHLVNVTSGTLTSSP